MKYYNFHTMVKSIKDLLSDYLKNNNIYYELSGTTADWYFVILADPAGAAAINKYIDTIIIKEA